MPPRRLNLPRFLVSGEGAGGGTPGAGPGGAPGGGGGFGPGGGGAGGAGGGSGAGGSTGGDVSGDGGNDSGGSGGSIYPFVVGSFLDIPQIALGNPADLFPDHAAAQAAVNTQVADSLYYLAESPSPTFVVDLLFGVFGAGIMTLQCDTHIVGAGDSPRQSLWVRFSSPGPQNLTIHGSCVTDSLGPLPLQADLYDDLFNNLADLVSGSPLDTVFGVPGPGVYYLRLRGGNGLPSPDGFAQCAWTATFSTLGTPFTVRANYPGGSIIA